MKKHRNPKHCCMEHRLRAYYKNKWCVLWISRPIEGIESVVDDNCFGSMIAKIKRVGDNFVSLQTSANEHIDIRLDMVEGIALHKKQKDLESKLEKYKLKDNLKVVTGGRQK